MTATALRRLIEEGRLDDETRGAAFAQMLRGEAEPAAVAGLLTAMRLKGETAEDLVAFVQLARAAMVPFPDGGADALDTCGAGGDGAGTFNISTAAALVAAAAGQPIVKHGNRSFSSSAGSADALEALGIAADVDPVRMAEVFRATGFAFCFAPRHHPALRHAAAVRRTLKFRTLFNLAGPLLNPARTGYQTLGVGRPELGPLMAEAVRRLGTRRTVVIHSQDGLDEVSPHAANSVWIVEEGRVRKESWTPEHFGLKFEPAELPRVDGPRESAQAIEAILAGEGHPGAPWALANAAAGLWCAGRAADLREAYGRVQETVREGAARRLLEKLRRLLPAERN